MKRPPRRLCLLASMAILLGSPDGACPQGSKLEYRAREVMIPMRDGVKLHTKIFEPVNAEAPSPILLTRTPYGIDAVALGGPEPLGPSAAFDHAGYVFVHQDVRGQFGSEGTWRLLMPPRGDAANESATDERTDAWDTIEWLLANVAGHNGRVGMWGISYDAWETAMALSEAHPALAAASPQASPGDMFRGDDLHHNGAFRLSYSFAWVAYMAAERGDADAATIGSVLGQDAFRFFREAGSLASLDERYFRGQVADWTEVLSHGNCDEYWERRNVVSLLSSTKNVHPAVLHVAGWFDAEDFRGPLDIYQAVERSDGGKRSSLVVGPWRHGGWNTASGSNGASLGTLSFGAPTAQWFEDSVELPFFEHHLRGGKDPGLPEALVFETGENAWHELERWPPADVTPRALYLRAGGSASFEPPAADEGESEFVSDPSDPVPYTARGPVFPSPEYMVEDQRFLDSRADVLTFVTEPLESDLVLAGPAQVRLHVATTGTDADWIVKLIDVYPDEGDERSSAGRPLAGAWLILSGDILRAKYRDSLEQPRPLEPGRVTALSFSLPDRLHRFRAGHCIAIQVHGTWFPLYDRNPQVFTDIYRAGASDFSRATQRVLHHEGAASRLVLPVLAD